MFRVLDKTTHPARREAGLKIAAVLPGRSKASAVMVLSFGLAFCRRHGLENVKRVAIFMGDERDYGLCAIVPEYPSLPSIPQARCLVAQTGTATRMLRFAAAWLPKAFHHSPEAVPDESVKGGSIDVDGLSRPALFFRLPTWALTQRKR